MSNKNFGPNSNGLSQNQALTKEDAEALLQAAIATGKPNAKLTALHAINAVDAVNGDHELGPWAVEQLVASLPAELAAWSTNGAKKKTLQGVGSKTTKQYVAVVEALQAPGISIYQPKSVDEYNTIHTTLFGAPYQNWNDVQMNMVNNGQANIIQFSFEPDTLQATIQAVMGVVAIDYSPSEDGSAFVAEWNDWPWLPGEGFYEGQ